MFGLKNRVRIILWFIGFGIFIIGLIPETFDWIPNCTGNDDLGFGGIQHSRRCDLYFFDQYHNYHWPGLFILIGLAWLLTMLAMGGLKKLIIYRYNKTAREIEKSK